MAAGQNSDRPVIDQATIFGDLANPAYQDNAEEAIHRFLGAGSEAS